MVLAVLIVRVPVIAYWPLNVFAFSSVSPFSTSEPPPLNLIVSEANLTSAFAFTVVAALTLPLLTVLTLAANVTPLLFVLLTRKAVVPALPPNALIPEAPPTVCPPVPLNSRTQFTFAFVETPPIVPSLVKFPATLIVQFSVAPAHRTSRNKPPL